MADKTKPGDTADAVSPAPVVALEKIPHAARRMGMSPSNFYRTAKRDGLRIIKVSERASAVPEEDVTAWIQRRIAACSGVAK
jgi:predicted DNA-binding transcriptional regulator AlpA